MKNKKIFKTLSALCAALVLMMGLSVTAFAQGTEELPAEDEEEAVQLTDEVDEVELSEEEEEAELTEE